MSDLQYLSLTLSGGFLLLGGILGGSLTGLFSVFLFWLGFLILFVQLLILAGKAVYRFFSWLSAPYKEPPEDK